MSFTANIDDVVAENRNRLLGKHPQWQRVRLKEIATILNGYPFDSGRFKKNGGTPLIRIRDIMPGKTETFYEGEFNPAFVVNRGEILVGMDGDFHCEPWTGEPALLNQRVCKITPDESRYAKQFMRYVLPGYLRAINEQTPSVTVKHLSSRTIADIPLPLPPLPEQQRIVAEIEKQFTRLEAGVAALLRVQANLKRYRATVLKAACEGRLVPTEAELAKAQTRKAKFETGEALLARILIERLQNWQGRGKYKEPATSDTANLPSLPEGWTWATADQVTSVITDGEHITPERSQAGILLLSARNVLDGRISVENVDYVPQHEYDRIAKRLVIVPGDVLLSCSGSVGRSAVVPDGLLFTLVRSVAVLKPLVGMGKYISIALRSPLLKQQILAKQTQTAQANIFQGKIKVLCVPLPPLTEQWRIVAEVERRLSVVEEIESVVTANLQRAARLHTSILHKAFTGGL